MTVTMNPPENGRQRRTLASQLDRFDGMIDGLDTAIKDVIADSVKEAVGVAVGTAVSEAVRATLIEIATNPDILSMLHGGAPPMMAATAAAEPAATSVPNRTFIERLGDAISSAWHWSLNKLKAAGRFVISPVVMLYRRYGWQKLLLGALTAGVLVGVFGHVATPWLLAGLGGLGAAATLLMSKVAAWTRRLCVQTSLG